MDIINRNDHFRRSKETSVAVWPVIENAVMEVISLYPDFKSQADIFLKKRKVTRANDKAILRPYLTRCMYEIAGGKDWQEITPILGAVELHNISTYQTNLCFDGKLEWLDTERKSSANNQVMAAMISLSAGHLLLERFRQSSEQSPGLSDNIAKAAWWLQKCNAEVYLGQYIDLNVLSSGDINGIEKLEENKYLDIYLKRCDLMGGSTFAAALIGCYFAGEDIGSEMELILHRYLRSLGKGTQVTNDLADYCFEQRRPYATSYMDLRAGRLTYPTYLLIKHKSPDALLIAGQKPLIETQNYKNCTKFLKDNINIHDRIEGILNSHIIKDINSSLDFLNRHVCQKDHIQPLTFATPFLFECKYMEYFKIKR